MSNRPTSAMSTLDLIEELFELKHEGPPERAEYEAIDAGRKREDAYYARLADVRRTLEKRLP